MSRTFSEIVRLPLLAVAKVFVILVGFPASGKSTIAEFLEQNGYKVVDADAIVLEQFKMYLFNGEEMPDFSYAGTWKSVIDAVNEAVLSYDKIAIDAPNLTLEERAELTNLAAGKFPVVRIFVKTDIVTCQARMIARAPEDRKPDPFTVAAIYAALEVNPPSPTEGEWIILEPTDDPTSYILSEI